MAERMGHSGPPLLVAVATGLLCLPYGFQYLLTDELKVWVFSLSGITLMLVLSWQGWLLARGHAGQRGHQDLALVGGVLGLGMLLLSLYFNTKVLGPTQYLVATLGLAACLISLLVARLRTYFMPSLLVCLVLIQGVIGLSTENDYRAANMLPVVQLACQEVVQGINPYLVEHPSVTSIQLYYFPPLIAPYCPTEWAGVDVRLVNVLCLAAVAALLGKKYLFDTYEPKVVGMVAILFASPMMSQMVAHGHIWVYFLACVALAGAILEQRLVAAALWVGLLMATYQLSAFLLLPLLAWLVRNRPPAESGRVIAITLACFVFLILPALLTVPDFLGHFFLDLGGRVSDNHIDNGDLYEQVSIAAPLFALLGKTGLVVLQFVVLLGGCAFLMLRDDPGPQKVLMLCGLCYCVVIALNPFLNRYFYVPGLIFISMSFLPARVLNEAAGRAL